MAAATGCAANMDEAACTGDAMNSCMWDMASMSCGDAQIVVTGCAANLDEMACTGDAMNNCEWDMAQSLC